MSNYSNFVGYVPDRLRLITSGGSLVQGELGLPNEYIASLAFGPVSTGNPVSGPGLGLNAAATFVVESGSSYIDFQNLSATTNSITVTGEGEGGGTDFEGSFSSIEYVGNQITGCSDRLKKLSLGALKRIDSLDNKYRIALYYSGGHDVTGEVYSPSLVQAAGNSGVYLNYGSGGLKGLDNTFTGYVSGMVIISGYADYGSGNHELLPYEDFLPVHQVGGLKFWAGSNWENVVLGMNHTGVGLGNGNTTGLENGTNGTEWNIYTHQNTTGVVIPFMVNDGVNAYVNTPTTNTGDLTITCSGTPITKPSGFFNRLDFNQNTDGRNLTVINNSNEYFYFPALSQIGAINIKSSGSLTFSGLCLTGVAQQYSNTVDRYCKFQATDDVVVNATTGTYLAAWAHATQGNYGGCVFYAVSESGNVTYEAANLKETNMGWYLQLKGSGTTGLINFPEATGFISTGNPHNAIYQNNYCFINMTPGGINAVDTVQTLNIPKLQQYSGTLSVYGLSGSTSTISGADLTSWSGSHNFYTSGDLYYTFTGGGGDGSGEVIGNLDHRTYLSGNTISGNRGTLKRCDAITYSLSGVDGTGILVADELREINGNINLRGLNGSTINVTVADVDYISGYLYAYTSGNVNYTFTGGPGSGSGVITSNIDTRVFASGSTVTGNLGTLSTANGIIISGGGVDSAVSLTVTGLHQIGAGAVKVYGVSGSTRTISGADLTYVSGVVDLLTSGSITANFNSGTARSGSVTNYIRAITYGSGSQITGNFGSLQNVGDSTSATAGYLLLQQVNGPDNNTVLNMTGVTNANGLSGYVASGSTGVFNLNTFHARNRVIAYSSGTLLINGTGDLPATTGGSVGYIYHQTYFNADITGETIVSGTYGGYVTGVGESTYAYNDAVSGTCYIGLPNLTGASANATYLNAFSNNRAGSGLSEIYAPQWAWSGSQYIQAYSAGDANSIGRTAKITIGNPVAVGQYISVRADGTNNQALLTTTGNTPWTVGQYAQVIASGGTNAFASGDFSALEQVGGSFLCWARGPVGTGCTAYATATGVKTVTGYIQSYVDCVSGTADMRLGVVDLISGSTSSVSVWNQIVTTGSTSIISGLNATGSATGFVNGRIYNGIAFDGFCKTVLPNISNVRFHVESYGSGNSIIGLPDLKIVSGYVDFSGASYTPSNENIPFFSGNLGQLEFVSGIYQAQMYRGSGYLTSSGASGVIGSYLNLQNTSGTLLDVNIGGITTVSSYIQLRSSGVQNFAASGNVEAAYLWVSGYNGCAINVDASIVPISGNYDQRIDCIGSGSIVITGAHTGASTGVCNDLEITGRTADSVITGYFNSIQTISGYFNLSSSGNTNIQLTGVTTIESGAWIKSLAAATFTHPLDNNSSLTAISTTYTGYAEYYYPIIISGDSITGASASALTRVGNISGQAGTYGGYIVSTGITNFSMPNVTGWHTQTEFDLPNVTGFNMSGLVFLGGTGVYAGGGLNGRVWQGFWLKLGSTLTGNLDFSNLTDIHYYSNNNYAGYGYFPVKPMRIHATGITSIDMSGIVSGVYKPAWRDVNSVLIPSETSTTEFICPALTGLTFGASGTTQRLLMNFEASGCPLNEASVDSILQTFASLDGTAGTSTYSGLTITLNGLCAPPSATGSGYRDTLTGAGRNCTVLINP